MTTAHQPTDVRIFHKQCRSLAEAGWDVTFVVPAEHDQLVDGVRISAVPRRATRAGRFSRTAWDVYRQALKVDAAVYHFHDPDLLPIGLLLWLRKKVAVYDVHEDYPSTVRQKEWLPLSLRAPAAAAVSVVERGVARRISAVVTVNNEIADRLRRDNPRTILARNYPRMSEFPETPLAGRRTQPAQLVSLGGISPKRSTRQIVDAMSYLPEDMDARLVLAGPIDSSEMMTEIRATPGWRRSTYVGVVPRRESLTLLATATASIVLFSPEINHYRPGSNRLFESLAAGVPVVVSNFPQWKSLVEDSTCGMAVDPTDPADIGRALEYLIGHPDEAEEMGRRGRQLAEANYTWESEQVQLLDLYEELFALAQNGRREHLFGVG